MRAAGTSSLPAAGPATGAAVPGTPDAPAGDPPRRGAHWAPRRRGGALLAVLVALALVVGGAAWWASSRPADTDPTGFVSRSTAASRALVDAAGGRWEPSSGLRGGVEKQVTATVDGTANPELYQHYREGVTDWSITVPVPGRYAVDLMLADFTPGSPGDRVFDVRVGDRVLAEGFDPAVQSPDGTRALHVTGMVDVDGPELRVSFTAVAGQPVASALSVIGMGPTTGARTLLDEQFDGPAGAEPTGPWRRATQTPTDTGELQAYTDDPSNSALDGDGALAITARREPFLFDGGSADYTSGKLSTEGTFSFTYGRVEARISTPAGAGLWAAFWAVGADRAQVDWPRSGEYDVMEVVGKEPSTVYAHVHGLGDDQDPLGWRDQPVSSLGLGRDTGSPLSEGWHVYAADVQPGAITFSVDGRPYFTAAAVDQRPGQDWPFDSPFYLVLNLAVGGEWAGPPDGGTTFPARMLVDRVLVTS
ncbi:family 16 glycosylhydrolase [Motilibacter aurantiacus]|uniref:family 16 glycosylhydrolase n=1 Tax=Motilibacter aurantiacus TaxID=2714955 RepID=UPI00140775D5|nr:family 16 glycosylhydrolase [Motilibacter aurantiacus]